MKEMGFNSNLKDVLLELHDNQKNRELLSQSFAYTYLIFDFDPHHTEEYEKDIPLKTIVENNINKVCEMAEYFVDETDPTIGKLYINYPMMESFKDCDSFEDVNYLTRMIKIDDVKKYKEIVGHRKMANKRIDGYSKSDFTMLTCQNVKKLGRICDVDGESMDYEITIDGEFICEYNSIAQTQRENHLDYKTLIKCLNGEKESHNGYVYKLVI